jgi:hypothetical protein
MGPSLHTEGHSIVFIGFFNPRIFLPLWFAHQGLIREEEAQGATIDVVHQEAVVFKAEWFHFEVFQERAMFLTTQSQYYEPLRDLALGTFRILQHTPLTMLGINRDLHFSTSEEEKEALGRKIAPREYWNEIGVDAKLATMTMSVKRPGDIKGKTFFKVESSQRAQPGVFVSVNDHYEVADREKAEGAGEILSILEASWKESTARTLDIAKKLVGMR